jgi:hypothetical protein
MQILELFDELAKTGNCGKSDGWIAARHRFVETGQLLDHGVSLG